MVERIEVDGRDCAHCAEKAGTSRREFITTSAASAVAAILVAACGGGGADATTVTGPVSLSVDVSKYTALASIGGIARVDDGGTPVAAVRTGANTFAAFSLICPHFGCTVGINGSAFRCPCHGAQFASTGVWIGGQRTTNLTSLATSYDAATNVLTISN
jgi:nitrite reductase/ring-hydroxylating ferredoxin subunit